MLNRRGFLGSIAGCAVAAVVPFEVAGRSISLRAFGAVPDHFIDVRQFGAVGDGVADDNAAIQSAIDACSEGLYFPPGTYRCNLIMRGVISESNPWITSVSTRCPDCRA